MLNVLFVSFETDDQNDRRLSELMSALPPVSNSLHVVRGQLSIDVRREVHEMQDTLADMISVTTKKNKERAARASEPARTVLKERTLPRSAAHKPLTSEDGKLRLGELRNACWEYLLKKGLNNFVSVAEIYENAVAPLGGLRATISSTGESCRKLTAQGYAVQKKVPEWEGTKRMTSMYSVSLLSLAVRKFRPDIKVPPVQAVREAMGLVDKDLINEYRRDTENSQ